MNKYRYTSEYYHCTRAYNTRNNNKYGVVIESKQSLEKTRCHHNMKGPAKLATYADKFNYSP